MLKWILLLTLFTNCNNNQIVAFGNKTKVNDTIITPLTLDHKVRDIVNHTAFQGFGELLLPLDNNSSYQNTSLRAVSSLMPYHSNVRPDVVLSSVNHMINDVASGKTIFYNFYTVQQKQQNPSLEQTGLFFFRGSSCLSFI